MINLGIVAQQKQETWASEWVYLATESSNPGGDIEEIAVPVTSPTNAEAYLNSNYPPENQAIGTKAIVSPDSSTYYVFEAQ